MTKSRTSGAAAAEEVALLRALTSCLEEMVTGLRARAAEGRLDADRRAQPAIEATVRNGRITAFGRGSDPVPEQD